MICPSGGVEMNHYAEKLVHPREPQEASAMDPILCGMVEEIHTPGKVYGVTRRTE